MVKKPRKTAPIMPALHNLCLEVPLSSDRLWAGIDLAGPAGADTISLTFQKPAGASPLDRPRKPTQPAMITATQTLNNPAPFDWGSVKRVMEQYKDQIAAMSQSMFQAQYMTQPLSVSSRDRILGFDDINGYRKRPERAEDLGCIDALVEAIRDSYDSDDIRMDYQVRDWAHTDPRFLNLWLFGPHGEFTGFARVPALEECMKRAARAARRGEVVKVRLENYPVEVVFRVTVLEAPMDAARLRHNPEWRAYFQFASYQDQAAWESMAAYDRTDLYG